MGTISLRFRAGELSYVLRMESSSYPPEIRWVIPRQLARSSRPGNPAEEVEWPAVDAWLLRARWLGIQTIISFLTDEEVGAYYERLPVPLHRIYGREGFTVMRYEAATHPRPLGWRPFELLAGRKPRLAAQGVERVFQIANGSAVDMQASNSNVAPPDVYSLSPPPVERPVANAATSPSTARERAASGAAASIQRVRPSP